MCGIFVYAGSEEPVEILRKGLQRLEYRGYDSWGLCFKQQESENFYFGKDVGLVPISRAELGLKEYSLPYPQDGKIASAAAKTKSTNYFGIAHTRWATHGGVTSNNAHPHLATDSSFAVVHNGIVENYQALKTQLGPSVQFSTETDTEVIVRLIEDHKQKGQSLFVAVKAAFTELAGRNTIAIINLKNDDIKVIAIRNGSPLVAGKASASDANNYYLASDYLAFANYTNQILQLDDMEGVLISTKGLEKFSLNQPEVKPATALYESMEIQDSQVDKGEFADFMLKEIHEQKHTVRVISNYSETELEPILESIRAARTVYTLGCGTAALAAGQIAYYLRKYAHINAIELKAYEIDSYQEHFSSQDLILAVSQSGETADTLDAVEMMRKRGGKIASLVNMLGSKLTQVSDFPYFSRTGPEICVASTKAFTAQVSWGYLLASTLNSNYKQGQSELEMTASAIDSLLTNPLLQNALDDVVAYLVNQPHGFILGRGQNFYIALEGALKLKEISYQHFEGFAAGELKHGVIALIEKGTPVVTIISEDEMKADMLSATAEVKARGGKIIGLASSPNELFDYYLPVPNLPHTSAIVNVLPLQLLAYYLGKAKGNNVDRPRNLAKSVTVK